MITFQDKVSLNRDPSIADINKIKDSDINALKAGINTNETNITNIKSAMAYSTTEVKTDKVWIDGKPIYRKTVNTGALPSAGGKVINHNISNIDYVTKIIGTVYRNTDNIFLPLPHATYDNTAISCYCDKTAITIIVYTDRSAFQESYVTLEYTKTTDVAL